MSVKGFIAGLMVAAVVLPIRMAAGETLEDVEKKIHSKVSGYKSLQFKMQMNTEMSTEGFSSKIDSASSFECMRKGKQVLSRMESKSVSKTKMGDQEEKTDINTLVINDGQFMWTYSETKGSDGKPATEPMATKQLIDPSMADTFDALVGFKLMEKVGDLKLLPDDKVDGKSVYVLESTPKDPAAKAATGRTVMYYDKDTGVSVKSVTYDKDNKAIVTMTTKDVKIDPSIKPERFEFKVPAGVTLQDLTKKDPATGQDAGAGGNTKAAANGEEPKKAAPEGEAKPKEAEPKKAEPKKDAPKAEPKKESKGKFKPPVKLPF